MVLAVTVRLAVLETPPDVAVIVVEPAATEVASPFEPTALLIAATDVADELQVTVVVRFCVEPSEYVPVAVNCWVAPSAMLELDGVIAKETSVADNTVSVVDPESVPDVAVIVAEPAATGVASPCEPAVLLMVATDVADELQVTDVVRTWVVLSENVPVAMNCLVVPVGMLGLVGVTAMDTSVAGVTVNASDPEMFPEVAVTVVEPAAAAVAKPELLIGATAVLDELQTTVVVRSCVVLSENVPVAVNCLVVPLAILGFAGVTARDTSVALETVSVVEPEVLPDVAVTVVLPAFFPYAYARPLLN